MGSDLKYLAVLAAIWLLLKFMPGDLWARLIMAVLGRRGLEGVGRVAMSAQPDTITLVPRTQGPGRPEAKSALEQLQRRGFARAGSFGVREMKDLPVHFMVKPGESAIAVVYEHPQVGVWCDIVSRYQNGGSWLITNAKAGGGLEDRPGHVKVRAPGLTATAMHLRFVRERPVGDLVSVPATSVATCFADAYAEEMAWRKGKGLAAAEVRSAGMEPWRRSA